MRAGCFESKRLNLAGAIKIGVRLKWNIAHTIAFKK